MAISIAEYKKGVNDPQLEGVIEIFQDNAPYLNYISYTKNAGETFTFTRETTLPASANRGYNTEYGSTNGVVTSYTETMKIGGGSVIIDRVITDLYGDDRLETEIDMKVKSIARMNSTLFFKGDATANALEIDGLENRIDAGHTIVQGDAALSLSNLRRAALKVKGDTQIIMMGEEMLLRLSDAKNDDVLAGQIVINQDEFGLPVTYFAGLRVVLAGEQANKDQILDFSEANLTTSIYVLGFGPDGIFGIEAPSGLHLENPQKESVNNQFDVEWVNSFVISNLDAAYRISGILDAPVVA